MSGHATGSTGRPWWDRQDDITREAAALRIRFCQNCPRDGSQLNRISSPRWRAIVSQLYVNGTEEIKCHSQKQS